ncbi:Zinc finger, RING-type [Corchorus capsularis]|uniref:Zinc finger, RING-type n=1 Tax=Corchorus capsularis TaxID=210143 RepID=A0A1R3K8V9_COCAP|nr:Zinc finger, RING-type [Corchorus capsularis]
MESIVIERRAKWKNLKQKLGFKAMGCCAASWSPRARISTISSILDEDEDEDEDEDDQAITRRINNNRRIQNQITENIINNSASTPLLLGQQQSTAGSGSGMNLAMALAAERNLRGMNVGPSPPTEKEKLQVKTLMRLIEETDGVEWNKKKDDNNKIVGGCDWMCCVCMERKKGGALIPCGHAFCRVCSRQVWLNRGSCPVCNRSILDVLDLF